jgi:hypothetical protein
MHDLRGVSVASVTPLLDGETRLDEAERSELEGVVRGLLQAMPA